MRTTPQTRRWNRADSWRPVLAGTAALLLAGCGSNGTGTVEEGTYFDGIETSSAVVQETPNGGYRTISGNPVVIVNGEVEPESMLPYGGGDEGIRQAEDETPFSATDL